MKTIAFFSSDSRYLYKADVYRVLALQEGAVIQFRYQKKYIHPDVLDNWKKNNDATIFFLTGNDLSIPEQNRALARHSIRKAKIMECQESRSTGLILFHLKLLEFVNYDICNSNPTDKLPEMNIFVSEVEVNGYQEEWDKVVDRVKSSYGNTLFFNIKSLSLNKNKVTPVYDPFDNQASYELYDELEYVADIAFYDFSGGTANLKISDSKSLITINTQSTIFPGANKDDRKFKVETKAADRSKQTTMIQIVCESPQNRSPEDKYDILIPINLHRGKFKPWWFGLYSVMASGALALSGYAGSIAKDLSERKWVMIDLSIAAVLLIIATSQLYRIFNKK